MSDVVEVWIVTSKECRPVVSPSMSPERQTVAERKGWTVVKATFSMGADNVPRFKKQEVVTPPPQSTLMYIAYALLESGVPECKVWEERGLLHFFREGKLYEIGIDVLQETKE